MELFEYKEAKVQKRTKVYTEIFSWSQGLKIRLFSLNII